MSGSVFALDEQRLRPLEENIEELSERLKLHREVGSHSSVSCTCTLYVWQQYEFGSISPLQDLDLTKEEKLAVEAENAELKKVLSQLSEKMELLHVILQIKF